MRKVIDVNVEDYNQSVEKITINLKFSHPENYSILKCFKNFEEALSLEAKKINLLKIQKTIFLNLPNLQVIDLRDNKLLKISKNFQNLRNLKILRLDDNTISYLPNFICNLENLETLTICNNKISYLPTSIQSLQKLKIFKFSNNQIANIPIEIGMLKSLECLHFDANFFTEIPTTICYLKHLSEMCFEWLEFLDPPFQKIIKENIGKTIISLIRNSLQDMIKQNVLYCDLINFIHSNSNTSTRKETSQRSENIDDRERENLCNMLSLTSPSKLQVNGKKNGSVLLVDRERSKEKSSANRDKENSIEKNKENKKLMKIFYAIENNYFGVIKALAASNIQYLQIKNSDNKTPLYLAIQNNKLEITNLILTHIDFSLISNSHIYLHKAIRLRDPVLTEKFINMGISVDACDDQGSTCFHVLFSSFTKQFYKCSLIGDILLRKSNKLNVLNNDNWAPIHIAARRASKESLLWIINQNKLLTNSSREVFDINMRGKNKWTPLHLSVNGFRIVETILLLKAGCDVFAKNSDGKIPRKVANGNFLITKLLRNYESEVLREKFPREEKINMINAHQICFTTVEDLSNIEDFNSFVIKNKFSKEENSEKLEKLEKIQNSEKVENRIFSPIMSGSEKEESIKSGISLQDQGLSSSNNLPNLSLNIGKSLNSKNSKNIKHLSCNDTMKMKNLLDDTLEANLEVKADKFEKQEKQDMLHSSQNKSSDKNLFSQTGVSSSGVHLPSSTQNASIIKEYANSNATNGSHNSNVFSHSQPNSSKKMPISLPLSVSNHKQNSRKNLLSNKIYYNGKPNDTPKLGMSENRQKSGKINLIPAPTKNNVQNQMRFSTQVVGTANNSNMATNGIKENPNSGKIKQKNNFLQNQKISGNSANSNVLSNSTTFNNNFQNHNIINNNFIICHPPGSQHKNQIPSSSVNLCNSPGKRINKVNLHFHKEIILNPESSIAEKYESLMHIKFTSGFFQSQEVENIIKSLLESLDTDTEFNQVNSILFIDILNMVLVNRYFDMLPLLEKMQKNFEKNIEKNLEKLEKNKSGILFTSNSIINKELINTISILNSIQESFKKTIIVNSELNIPLKAGKRDPRLDISLNKSHSRLGNKSNNRNSRSQNKLKYHNSYNQVHSTPQIKHINRYFDTREGNSENLMNTEEIENSYNDVSNSQSYILMHNYGNYQRPTRNLLEGYSEQHTVNDESCNIADSSWSMARYDLEGEQISIPLQFQLTQANNTVSGSMIEEAKCDGMNTYRENGIKDDSSMPVAPDKKVETSFFDN